MHAQSSNGAPKRMFTHAEEENTHSSVLWKAIVMSKIYQLAKDTTVQVTEYYIKK